MQEAKREDAAKVSAELSERVHTLESKLAEREQEAARQREQEAVRQHEQEAARQRELEQEAARQRELEQEAARQRECEQEAARQRELEQEAARQRECEQEATRQREQRAQQWREANARIPAADLRPKSGRIPAQLKRMLVKMMTDFEAKFKPDQAKVVQIGVALVATAVLGHFLGFAFTLQMLAVVICLFIGWLIYLVWGALVLGWWGLAWLSSFRGLAAPPQTEFFWALLVSEQTFIWCAVAALIILVCNVFEWAANMVVIAGNFFRRCSANTEEDVYRV
jgi:hypothetical protein